MKILTVSASPYLLTKLGRIHSSIILDLYKKHTIYSAVWNHDTKWFSADSDGHYFYEKNKERICQLLPYQNQPPSLSSPQLYEIFSKVNPEVVISTGDYNEVDAIFAIKTLNPKKFKWIHVFTMGAGPIKETYNDVFKYVDFVIHTNKKSQDLVSKISPVFNDFSYIGVNEETFFYKNEENDEKLNVISCAKNSQMAGIGSILNSSQFLGKDFNIYCHTNIYDDGDYDLNALKARYDVNDVIKFPENYVGLNDGISDDELNCLYNRFDVFIDVSCRSSTGMALIESMASGCLPVVSPVGALKEIINLLPEECRFFVEGNTFIGNLEEEFCVVSPKSLIEVLKNIQNMKKNKKGKFADMKKTVAEVAKNLKRKDFLKKIEESIEKVNKENEMIVDSF